MCQPLQSIPRASASKIYSSHPATLTSLALPSLFLHRAAASTHRRGRRVSLVIYRDVDIKVLLKSRPSAPGDPDSRDTAKSWSEAVACDVTNPVRADALGGHPGQVPAEACPQVVVPAGGDRLPVAVAQQLPVRGCVPLVAVLDQAGHQGRGDRLPTHRLAFSRSRIRHWSGSRSRGRSASAPPRRQAVSVGSRKIGVSSSGSSPADLVQAIVGWQEVNASILAGLCTAEAMQAISSP